MDLNEHYTTLYKESVEKIAADAYQIDTQIDSATDNRFGITLLIRPDIHIKNKIQGFLEELKAIDPEQYYYPNSDVHITVLSIISCYDGFNLATISIPDYVKIIKKSLVGIQDITINFQGITASPSAIMVQGFTNTNSLNDLRNNLRTNFINSGLEQSIDERYSIQTAHTTVARFRKEIKNKEKLLEILEKYRDFDFGKFNFKECHLVYNDWYQRDELVKEIHEFRLK
ncbi:2'-5' RNA ligase family protein [Flavobacterium yafengii]|uniref:2'-5' RNA ligase family protein n=1 Tax=Flavobacterium yafengii TaxID=3041253 RepID=UPI0024A978B9|nr:mutarotase [Flavobacterium yafengii]MDI6048037.1 mutarotase [Flavobacterium yafengii]